MSAPRNELRELFTARYGLDLTSKLPGSPSAVLETLLSHRSIRRFSDRPAPEGTLELLVAAAQSAASSSNLQLWSVISVQDPDRRKRLASAANNQMHVRESALFLVWLADLNRATVLARSLGIEPEGLAYFEMFLMASIDAALAAQNAVIAAEAHGLGGVYIGALRNRPKEVAELLELPPRVFALFGLCLGYPDPNVRTAIKPRLPQSIVLSHDTYKPVKREVVSQYDELMSKFYSTQGMEVPAGGWSLHCAQRVESAQSLNGRDRLKELLLGHGFALR